jgi:S1-C subfamily serine protease
MNASVKLIEAVLPTSVSIGAVIPENHPSAQILGTERSGSGTLVDSSGVVLTVNYVVLGAESIEVTLLDDTKQPGEIIAQDFFSGLAAIKIPGGGFPSAALHASTSLSVGQEVFILASAGGDNRRINGGMVSSLSPFDAYWEYHLERSIRTTAMNPGLGGGALFTLSGHLTGIVSLDLAEIGRFTMAIPAEYFLDHRDELLRHGRRTSRPPRAWVGLYCYEIRDHVVIAGVLPGTPGERGGLRPSDVILVVDGKRINQRRSLYHRLWEHQPGDVVTFEVFRNNAVRQVEVCTDDAEKFFS